MSENNSYEAMLIFSVANGDDVTALVEKFKALIEENGTFESIDEGWGKRKLAYPINDETEGHYALYNFTSGPDFPAELERVAKITDGVLRSLVIRK